MTLQDIDADFRARVAKDKKLAEIRRKIAAGKATFRDTAAYSERISNLLGETLSGHIEQIPASERAKICEWLLRNQYADTNETLAAVQRALDEADGIRLAPQKPPFPAKRVNKVSGALEDVTASMDVIRRRANGPVANVSKSFHDDYIKRNAEFRSEAGLPCYVVREAASGCCKWCTEIAGRYECNGDLPEDVYRRHDNCSCTTTYENGRMRQDVWSKRQWEAPEPDAGAEPPTFFTEENRPAGFQPKVLTGGEKVARQSKNALQNAADGGIIKVNDSGTALHSISDETIKNLPEINVFKDRAMNQAVRGYAQELLREAQRHKVGTEVGGIITLDKEMKRHKLIIGEEGAMTVDIPKCKQSSVTLHNHASGETFSKKDILKFVADEQARCMFVVGNNGAWYALQKADSFNWIKFGIDSYPIDGADDFNIQILERAGDYGLSYFQISG